MKPDWLLLMLAFLNTMLAVFGDNTQTEARIFCSWIGGFCFAMFIAKLLCAGSITPFQKGRKR